VESTSLEFKCSQLIAIASCSQPAELLDEVWGRASLRIASWKTNGRCGKIEPERTPEYLINVEP